MIDPRKTALRLALPALAVMALGAALPHAARAQGIGNFNGAPTGPVVGNAEDNKDNKRQAAPPALPGSRTQKTEAAPAAPGASDLPPTEALFDAINRGDILSARDAINRGADSGGRNVLGMTPLDLSIDLGRNEITFLLLSLRPANARDAGPAQAQRTTPGTTPGATQATTAARTEPRHGGKAVVATDGAAPAAPARVARATPERAAKPAKPEKIARAQPAAPAPAPAPQPRQYAGERGEAGTPIPQMGFLGFGSVTR